MKFTSIAAATLVAASASAQDVACRINGQQGSVVDLDTGVCSFEIPSSEPVVFDFTAIDDYTVDAYYVSNGQKFWNDIANAGRTIDVPARDLYNNGNFGFFHVHDSVSPTANSTSALRKRFHAKIMNKRDEIADLVAHIKTLSGDAVTAFTVEVNAPDVASSSASGSDSSATSAAAPSGSDAASGSSSAGHNTRTLGSGHESDSASVSASASDVTVTRATTTLITITSCSANKCSEAAVPATRGPTTATVDGTVTVYTTWCPLSGVDATFTEKETTVITVTSCSHNRCSRTAIQATRGETTTTIGGEESVITTWQPVVTGSATTTTRRETTIITVTSCSDHKCVETEVPATEGTTSYVSEGQTIIYTTLYPVASTTTAPGAGATPEVPGEGATTTTTTRRPGVGGTRDTAGEGSTATGTTGRPGVGGPGAPGSGSSSEAGPGVGGPGGPGGPGSSTETNAPGGPGVGGPGGPGVGGPGGPGSSTETNAPGGPGVGGPGVGGPGVGGPGESGAPSVSSTRTRRPGVGGGRPTSSASESLAGESSPTVSSIFNGAGKMGASVLAVIALPLAYLL